MILASLSSSDMISHYNIFLFSVSVHEIIQQLEFYQHAFQLSFEAKKMFKKL